MAVTLIAAVAFMAANGWAAVPDPTKCTVGSGMINACPYDHPYGLTDAERYQDIQVTCLDENYDPVAGYTADNFSFDVQPHSGYPTLGCQAPSVYDCEDHYTVTCQYAATNLDGEMLVRVEVGPTCSPSMTCPVEIYVTLSTGMIPTPIEILQNSHDLVPNGDVRSSDLGSFSEAYNNWRLYAIATPAADFVWESPDPWGKVGSSDFGAFSVHYKDCCGVENAPGPEVCDPWTDPCP
jgi:hypothetical protein